MKRDISLWTAAIAVWLFAAGPASAAQLSAGSFVFDGGVTDVVHSGGNTFVAGTFTQQQAPTGGGLIVPEGGTGAPNPSQFPKVLGRVNATAPDGSGGWYIGGDFTQVGGQSRGNLAHILVDGTVDAAWNPSPNGTVGALAVAGSTVYAAGGFTTVGGQSRNYLAALSATTGDATAFNPNPSGGFVFVDVLVVSGSTLYVAGAFTAIGGQSRKNLAALDATTGSASSWNPSPSGPVHELAVSGSTVYVSGDFSTIGGQSRSLMAGLDTTTGNATAFNPSPSDTFAVAPLLAVSGSTVYAAGLFTTIGGQARSNIAALDAATGAATAWNPGTNGIVFTLAVSGTTVYAGGDFTTAGGQSRNDLVALDTTTAAATSWNPNPNNPVRALAVGGSNVYVGGEFYGAGPPLGTVSKLAKLNAAGDLDTAWNSAPGGGPNGPVRALAVSGSTLYVGGEFDTIGGQSRNGLAALDIASGNATSFNPSPSSSFADIEALTISGSTLYVGGDFVTVGGQSRTDLAALDLGTGNATTWNPDPDNIVGAMAVSGATVYVAGAFTTIGGKSRNMLAAVDATTGAATSWNPNPDSTAFGTGAIAVAGGTIYTSGDFTTIGGQSRNGLAALDAATGNATSWNPSPSGGFGPPEAIAVSGTVVYVGGEFTTIGGQSRKGVAALDAATGNATAFNPSLTLGVGGAVSALAVSGSTVFAGGWFSAADGTVTGPFAILTDAFAPPPDTTAPETMITSGPADGSTTNDSAPAFRFSASEAGSTFVCAVDAGGATPCTTGFTTPTLTEGQHTVAVTATDVSGNTDATPATRTFTVDTVAPTIVVITPTDDQHFVQGASVSSAFSCTDTGGSGVAACNAQTTVDTASAGTKNFMVTATDAAGNQATNTVPYTVDAPASVNETPTPTPGAGTTPPASTPSVKAPRTVTRAAIAKGIIVRLGDLKARSTVALRVRSGSRTLATFKTIASALGKASLKIKLPKARLAKLRGKTLRLRYSLTTADGTKHVVARSLKVK